MRNFLEHVISKYTEINTDETWSRNGKFRHCPCDNKKLSYCLETGRQLRILFVAHFYRRNLSAHRVRNLYVWRTGWFMRPIRLQRINFRCMQQQLSTCVNVRHHCRLKPPFQRTPAHIRINLILSETPLYMFAVCVYRYVFLRNYF